MLSTACPPHLYRCNVAALRRIGTMLGVAWGGFVDFVGVSLDYCVRRTNPRHAVASYIVFNVLVTAVAYPCTDSWPNFFTVTGYWVTFTGLVVAFIELYRTRTVANSIREAVLQETDAIASSTTDTVSISQRRFLPEHEAAFSVDAGRWRLCALMT